MSGQRLKVMHNLGCVMSIVMESQKYVMLGLKGCGMLKAN